MNSTTSCVEVALAPGEYMDSYNAAAGSTDDDEAVDMRASGTSSADVLVPEEDMDSTTGSNGKSPTTSAHTAIATAASGRQGAGRKKGSLVQYKRVRISKGQGPLGLSIVGPTRQAPHHPPLLPQTAACACVSTFSLVHTLYGRVY